MKEHNENNQEKNQENLNPLENLSDEELIDLKNKAIKDEDYDYAKIIKLEKSRRKWLKFQGLKENDKIEKYNKVTKLQAKLFDEKNISEDDVINEIREEYSYNDLCEPFEYFAESLYIKTHFEASDMKKSGRSDEEIDEYYYKEGQKLYWYLKNFCSGYSNNISSDEEKNKGKIIVALGLNLAFHNIYRRCLTLSDQYYENTITGKDYFESITHLFYELSDNIQRTDEPGFYDEKHKDSYMPMLSRKEYIHPGI